MEVQRGWGLFGPWGQSLPNNGTMRARPELGDGRGGPQPVAGSEVASTMCAVLVPLAELSMCRRPWPVDCGSDSSLVPPAAPDLT